MDQHAQSCFAGQAQRLVLTDRRQLTRRRSIWVPQQVRRQHGNWIRRISLQSPIA